MGYSQIHLRVMSLVLAAMTGCMCFSRVSSLFYPVIYNPARGMYNMVSRQYYQIPYGQTINTLPSISYPQLPGSERLLSYGFPPVERNVQYSPPTNTLKIQPPQEEQLSSEDRSTVVNVIKSLIHNRNTTGLLNVLNKMSATVEKSLQNSINYFAQRIKKYKGTFSPHITKTLRVMDILRAVLDVIIERSFSLQLYLAERLTNLESEDIRSLKDIVNLFTNNNEDGRVGSRIGASQNHKPKKSMDDPSWTGSGATNIKTPTPTQTRKGLTLEDAVRARDVLQSYMTVMAQGLDNEGIMKSLAQVFLQTDQKDGESLRKFLSVASQEMVQSSVRATSRLKTEDLPSGEKFKFINILQTILNVMNAETPPLQFYHIEQLRNLLKTQDYQKVLHKAVVLLSRYISSKLNGGRSIDDGYEYVCVKRKKAPK